MKKFIIITLLFSIVTSGVFAQLTFSGSVYAGVQVEIPWDSDEDATAGAYHRVEGVPQFNLVTTFTRANSGVRLDTTFRGDFQGEGSVTVDGIYGWADFLDNTLRLSLGRISDAVWIGNIDPDNLVYFDKVTGLRLEYATPLPGLSVGAAFRFEGSNFGQVFERVILGANFVHPMFNAVFAYNVGANGHALFGFNFTGIPDLTAAALQVRATHLASWDDPGFGGVLELKQRVGFRVLRPLTVSLFMGQTIFAEPRGDFAGRDMELFFTPGVSYIVQPGLTASFTAEFRSYDYFDRSRFITLTPGIELMLTGGTVLYAQYELVLGRYIHQSGHRIGMGLEFRF